MSRKLIATIAGVLGTALIAGTTLVSQAATIPTTEHITAVTTNTMTVEVSGPADLQVFDPAPLAQVYHHKTNGGKIIVTGLAAGTAYDVRIAPSGHGWGNPTMFWTTATPGLTGEPGATISLNPVTAPQPAGLPKVITTGGSAITNATDAEEVTLPGKGTYLVSVRAKVTSINTVTATVYPQFFVYSQALAPGWAGNLFNIGSGALPVNNSSIDNYYTGTGLVTVTGATTLHVYAFGYDGDHGSGSYTLEALTVEYIQVG